MIYKDYTILAYVEVPSLFNLTDDGQLHSDTGEEYGQGEAISYVIRHDDMYFDGSEFDTIEDAKKAIDADWTIEIHGKDGSVVTIPLPEGTLD